LRVRHLKKSGAVSSLLGRARALLIKECAHNDVTTASLIENWIDETERQTWFLSEIVGSRVIHRIRFGRSSFS